jgi:hypothetical protein
MGSDVEGVAPFAWSAEGEAAAIGADSALEGVVPFDLGAIAGDSEPADPYAALYAAAAPPSEPVAAAGDSLAALIAAEPFAPPDAPEPPAPAFSDEAVSAAGPPAAAPAPFITADGRVDLTVGWDDLDRTLAEATPSNVVDGFDEIVAEFGADGIAPFDLQAEDGGTDEGWAPFTEDDFAGWESGDAEPFATADEAGDGVGEPALPDVPSQTAAAMATVAEDLLWPEDARGAQVSTEPESANDLSSEEAAALTAEVADLSADIDQLASETSLPAIDAARPDIEPVQPDVEAAPLEVALDLPEMEFAPAEIEAAARAAPDMDAVAALTAGWDSIEEELAAAIPPSGLPAAEEGLDLLTDEGLVPFDFESHLESIDPLANPDAVGDPLDFDDLLLVTSQDATAPLGGGYGAGSDHGPAPDAFDRSTDVDDGGAGADTPDDLAGIVPFAFEETAQAVADAAIDFSDVEDVLPASTVDDFALFDEPIAEASVEEAEADADDDEGIEESPFDSSGFEPDPAELALEAAAGGDGWEAVDEEDETAAATIAAEPASDFPPAPKEAPAPSADAGRPSRWPAFISGTSELVDRFGEVGVLFARLREEKNSLVDLGVLQIDRSLATALATNGHARTHDESAGSRNDDDLKVLPLVAVAAGGTDLPRARPVAVDPEVTAEITRWRERLRQGQSEAEAVAAEVEQRVATGGSQTTYLRVLGEAYLKLGRSDLAAQQFRAASARRARRP